MSLSVAIITLNEEDNIAAALETVKWADEIVLVDGGSRDQTLVKARAYTSSIHHVPFKDFASQKNAALVRCRHDWIFLLDADERVPESLAREIRSITRSPNQEAVYAVKRTTTLFGKNVRFGGLQDDFPIRLFLRGKARFEQPIHEKLVSALPVKKLRHSLIHYSTRNMKEYRLKLEQYVSLELEGMKQSGRRVGRLETMTRPLFKFLFLYFWKWGFLDGAVGLRLAALASYYDYLKFSRFYRASS